MNTRRYKYECGIFLDGLCVASPRYVSIIADNEKQAAKKAYRYFDGASNTVYVWRPGQQPNLREAWMFPEE